MSTIMCTRDLWRWLDGRGDLCDRLAPEEEPAKLGAWSAKAVVLPEGSFCVALNEPTYLTLVFPFVPLPAFLGVFSAALRIELEHIGIPEVIIRAEVAPFFGEVTFAKNSNRSLLGSLNDVCFHLDCALEDAGSVDLSGLVGIQHDLNLMPHANRDLPFPVDAALLLLSGEAVA